ncbi:MAG: RDD family protein [Candidatus Hodarchaeota archaeon]
MDDNVLIEAYIQKIDYWLPYPRKKKNSILKNIRAEVSEAIHDSGNSDPVIAYGDPYHIAKGLSLSQDWGMIPAGWGIRTFAFIIDAILVLSVCLIYLLFGFVLLFRIDINQALMITKLSEAFDILQSDLNLGTFLLLAIGLLFYVLGAFLIYSAYFIGLEKVYSTTLGKKLLGLYVVDNSGIRMTWKQSIIRNFTKLPGIIEFLPFDIILGMLKMERGQGEFQRATEILAEAVVVRSVI